MGYRKTVLSGIINRKLISKVEVLSVSIVRLASPNFLDATFDIEYKIYHLSLRRGRKETPI